MTACRCREAATYASATAGRAVIFAGVTVAISITGLAVIGIPFVTKLGMGGALGVLTAVLYATFLLPGLLSLLGTRSIASACRSCPRPTSPRRPAAPR